MRSYVMQSIRKRQQLRSVRRRLHCRALFWQWHGLTQAKLWFPQRYALRSGLGRQYQEHLSNFQSFVNEPAHSGGKEIKESQ